MSDPSSGRYGNDRDRLSQDFFKESPPPPWPPESMTPPFYYYAVQANRAWRAKKNYGCLGFLLDCVMLALTSGLWFVWIFVREMRRAFPRD